jgi:hypothetical protein
MSMSRVPNQDERLRAAAFLQEVFGTEAEPDALAPELELLSSDAASFTWTIELTSSIGDAAFLIYQFTFNRKRPDGKWGRELFREGLETLELAGERNTPGPRIVAHAETDTEGYLLATTPAAYRLLTGAAGQPEPAPGPVVQAGEESKRVRAESADELLRLLKQANDQARNWLAAIRADSAAGAEAAGDLPFNQQESALALFLNDETSVQDLLRLMAMLVESSRPAPG